MRHSCLLRATRWRTPFNHVLPTRLLNAASWSGMLTIQCQKYTTNTTKGSWSRYSLKPLSKDEKNTTNVHGQKTGLPKKMHKAYIALGSNLGDRIHWIESACRKMLDYDMRIRRTSSLWETEPMYVLDQASFINGVCEVETSLEPLALLDTLQSIENDLGREKIIDKGPRNIDLDILLYDDETFNHERLQIPHSLMLEREFVLRPLSELIPNHALDPKSPWKVTQDYLNALPQSEAMTTVTPLTKFMEPLRPLKTDRKTQIMQIINVTPDSFSGGRDTSLSSDALSEAIAAIESSTVSIVDVGGQSSAPGAKEVSAEEEIRRVKGLIENLDDHRRDGGLKNQNFAISIDTYRADVVEATSNLGVDIINDISAGALDPKMLPTMAQTGLTVCLMHMRGDPTTMNKLTSYPDGLIPTIASELLARIEAAEAAGIRRWRIILDPGIGFAKTAAQNLEILRRFDELRDWPGLRGFPWLIGSSRKGFIGKITGVEEPNQRVMGTAATVAAAVVGGADIVRVHDLKEMSQVVKMSDAIWRAPSTHWERQ
ncbi:Dihydropteroate synthase-like protein [Bisporella sp. PMI_857]|nr:Dihydropteroate synthase-like protein [Bisporella sp. PMI_857]